MCQAQESIPSTFRRRKKPLGQQDGSRQKLAIIPYNQTLIPRTHVVEGENCSYKLSSWHLLALAPWHALLHTHVKTNKHVKIVKAIKPLYGRARPTLMPTASHSFGNPLTQLIRAHSQHSLCAPPTWASVLTHTLYTSSRLHTRTHTCARPNNHTGFLLSN